MSQISSNTSFTPPPSYSGTQEGGIAQTKAQQPSGDSETISTQQPFEGAKDQAQGSTSENRTTSFNGSSSSALKSASLNDGGATAEGAIKDQFQQAGSKFVNNTTLSQKATEFISKTIQSKVALSTMTLKMQPLVLKMAGTTENALVNENRAPKLPEPPPLVPESDESSSEDSSDPSCAIDADSDDSASTAGATVSTAKSTAQTSAALAASTVKATVTTAATAAATTASAKVSTAEATVTTAEDAAAPAPGEDPLSTETGPTDQMNVFVISEKSADISTQGQLNAVQAQIAAANSQDTIQQADIKTEMYNINQQTLAAAAAAKHHSKSTGNIIGWVTNSVMLAAGAVMVATGVGAGIGAALIIGATLSMIMMSSAGTKITAALVTSLEGPPCKLSSQDASIIAQVIIAVVIMALSMGGEASGIGDALSDAAKAGSEAASFTTEAAIESTEEGASEGMEESIELSNMSSRAVVSTTDAAIESGEASAEESAEVSDQEVEASTRDADVGLTSEDRAMSVAASSGRTPASAASRATMLEHTDDESFVSGLSKSATNVGKGAYNSVVSAPARFEAMGSSLARSASNAASRTMASASRFADAPLTATASAIKSAGMSAAKGVGDVAMLPVNVVRGSYEMLSSALEGLSKFASDAGSIMTRSAADSEEVEGAMNAVNQASNWERLQAAGQALYNAVPKNAMSTLFVTVNLLQAGLNLYKGYVEYQATLFEGEAEKFEGQVKIDQAEITQMQDFITNTNTVLQQILQTVNQEITNASSSMAFQTPLQNLV